MTVDLATPVATPEASPDGTHDGSAPAVAPARGSTSVVLIVALALSVVFLFAIATLMAAPAGGCGGG